MNLKNVVLGTGVAILLSFAFFSCSNSDNIFNIKESFTGKFAGEVEFRSPQDSIFMEKALVEVSYENNLHGVHFPGSIPSLVNIEMEDNGEALMNVGADSLHLIRVTKESLIVVFQDEDTQEFWSAKCLRQ